MPSNLTVSRGSEYCSYLNCQNLSLVDMLQIFYTGSLSSINDKYPNICSGTAHNFSIWILMLNELLWTTSILDQTHKKGLPFISETSTLPFLCPHKCPKLLTKLTRLKSEWLTQENPGNFTVKEWFETRSSRCQSDSLTSRPYWLSFSSID